MIVTHLETDTKESERKGNKNPTIENIPEEWEICSFLEATRTVNSNYAKLKTDSYQKAGKYPIIDQGMNLIAGYIDIPAIPYKGTLPVIIFGLNYET